jgi:hypothetical protein
VDDPGKDGNVSMPEQVKRPNPWRRTRRRRRKTKKMMIIIIIIIKMCCASFVTDIPVLALATP